MIVRNDSMTHLVQAACVNLADVRRFQIKNEAFKYEIFCFSVFIDFILCSGIYNLNFFQNF